MSHEFDVFMQVAIGFSLDFRPSDHRSFEAHNNCIDVLMLMLDSLFMLGINLCINKKAVRTCEHYLQQQQRPHPDPPKCFNLLLLAVHGI